MKEFINPKDFYISGRAYSHGVKVDVGDSEMLFITGEVAKDEKGKIVGEGDTAEQADYIFKKIMSILSEAGMNLMDLVKINIYLANMDEFEKVSKIRSKYLKESKPAATTIEIARTAAKGCEVEIDAIAIKKK